MENPEDAIDAFVQSIREQAAGDRFLEFFDPPHPAAIYHQPGRNGVAVIAVPNSALTEAEKVKILRWRLAQYLAVGFVSPIIVYAMQARHEPKNKLAPMDVHFMAARPDTGELLAYVVMGSLQDPPPKATLRTKDRPLFPVEKAFGWGAFNRLAKLPDIPLGNLREMKRLVRNQSLPKTDAAAARAPIELCLGVIKTLTSPGSAVEAFLGDLEEMVAKRHLDYFWLPSVVVHCGLPTAQGTNMMGMHIVKSECFPFAVLIEDLKETLEQRIPAIEAALRLPGKEGLAAVMRLREDPVPRKSSLQPPHGLDTLSDTRVEQRKFTMNTRSRLVDEGRSLRRFDVLSSLSDSEAVTLRLMLPIVPMQPGESICRKGDPADCIYLIDNGEVQVMADGKELARLGEGQYFGEIGVLTGGTRNADVIAMSEGHLLKIEQDVYEQYLSERNEVESKLSVTATRRAQETARRLNH